MARELTSNEFLELQDMYLISEEDRTEEEKRRFRELSQLDMPTSTDPNQSFTDYIFDIIIDCMFDITEQPPRRRRLN